MRTLFLQWNPDVGPTLKRRFIDDEAVEDNYVAAYSEDREISEIDTLDDILPATKPAAAAERSLVYQAPKHHIVTPVRGITNSHGRADKKVFRGNKDKPKMAKPHIKTEYPRGEGGKAFATSNNKKAANDSDDEESEEDDIAFGILDTGYNPENSGEPHAGVHDLAMIKDVKALEPRLDRMGQLKWPHRLFVTLTKDNTLIATLFLPRMEDVGVSEYPLRMILKHAQFEDIRKAVKFHTMAPMVSASNPNIALLNGRDKDSGPRKCILRLLHPHRTVNKDMIKCWGENVAKLVERFGSAGRFDSFYNFAGNLTPPAPKELAYYITLSEVFKIMEARHQNKTIHQLLDDDTIPQLYIPHHLMSDAKELAGATHPTNGTDAFLNGLTM
jgi:hypothetical protein